ncbi:peptidylprolyl isomerase [Novosphingobium sp.]|uniref:peptidylprolyl isomerase n=1 Tax=Novosphingobium sp. TaxID=1874826 RepID=UPI0025E24A18|nr:peptidylprolyl isomerase [Novosphingobium sp.]MCC6925577.1 SurA N-terminal domain-containing protein [Novosphingobium sp.]
MIQFFRRMFDSKLGVGFTLVFLGLIALAFAGGDIAGSGGFGAFSSSSKIAQVGDDKVTATELDGQIRRILDQARQDNPRLTVKEFLANDGLEQVLSFVIDNKAALQWGEKYGIYIGERLIDSEVAKDPKVQAPDGKVDRTLYQQMLSQRGMTDAEYRGELAEQLMTRQLLGSTLLGLRAPTKVTRRYAASFTETRKGAIVLLPPAAFAPGAAASDAEVQAWYNNHKASYMLPERRTIRYATYTDAAIKNVPVPTDAEVAARYNAQKAKFAATDKRKLSQVIFPTEAAAKQVLAETGGGKALEAVARSKGLAVAALGSLTKDAYALQSSADSANAVFAAENGKVVGPFKAPLGWVVVRVDGREATAGKTLDQARPELLKELGEEKRRGAIIEFGARIEDELSNGASLADVAKELGLEVVETPALTSDGAVFGQDGTAAPALLERIIPTAFQADGPGSPQLAEIEPGKTFMIFDVGKLTPAAPPPLAEIRDRVAEDARIAKGEKAAEEAARKLKGQLEKGVPVDVAVASLGVALPPVDHVTKNRQELRQMGQNVPRPLLMLFATARGKVTLMQAPRGRGWYVVTVSEVIPGPVPNDEALKGLSGDLEQAYSNEYGDAMRAAFRNEIGTNRNEDNVKKLGTQLAGGN